MATPGYLDCLCNQWSGPERGFALYVDWLDGGFVVTSCGNVEPSGHFVRAPRLHLDCLIGLGNVCLETKN